MPSRKIEDLHPDLQPDAWAFLDQCEQDPWLKAHGITVLITCTYRSNDEQAALYAIGRTKPGKIVTNAKPGESMHNKILHGQPASQALDFVPLRHGKPIWGTAGDGLDSNPADDDKDDLEAWQYIVAIAERIGWESASKWKSFKEWPHIQKAVS